MRMLVGLAVAAVLSCAGLAQQRGNFSPVLTGGSGSVVFPGGTAANSPNIQRFMPNVVHPGGGGPQFLVPNANGRVPANRFSHSGGTAVWGYPVYIGSYGTAYDASAYAPDGAPAVQQSPNVTIIMPPPQPPVVINHYDAPARPQMNVYQPDTAPAASEPPATASEPQHYLLAFKDHTIYSAIAYWVDGDTLHYFTAGNTHNQVSVSLIDRDMTRRLNQDAGVTVNLPPAK